MYILSICTKGAVWHPRTSDTHGCSSSSPSSTLSSPPLWTRWFWPDSGALPPLPFCRLQASVPLTSRWVCMWGTPKRESSSAQPGHKVQEKPVWLPGPLASLWKGKPGHWQPPAYHVASGSAHLPATLGRQDQESQKEKGNLYGWRRALSSYSKDGWVSNLSRLTHLTRVTCK